MPDVDDVLDEIVGVPTRLETPATDISLSLPTVTRLAVLPLQTLQWENFERLCLRYARSRGTVVRSQLYGIKGQAQHGIDLYVRLVEPPQYEAYQCKRLEEFTSATIRKAVEKFLKGKWHDSAKAFRIMTSHAIEDAKIAEAIETAANTLSAKEITFEVLGQVQISEWLKDKPRIVDEFFSRPWIEPFCGADALKELGKRLNATDVGRYRKELKRFYESIFNRHDPGIPVPVQLGEREVSFRERFIVPDVYGATGLNLTSGGSKADENTSDSSGDTKPQETSQPISSPVPLTEIRIRAGIDRWLSQAQRSVILGGPGSGKSVLLRVLAIELLSEEPLFKEAAVQWGSLLPIWIPFSFWTSLNAGQTSPIAFSKCLETWFTQFDQKEVWKLVEAALEDDRLLLLVDSLDEWTDETAARTTSDLLHTYIQLHNFPAVMVSRPHGFDRVSLQGPNWQRGQLAPLSVSQQKELACKWLYIHNRRRADQKDDTENKHNEYEEAAAKEATEFVEKLARSKDLAQLAEVPLTLLLLLLLHLQNSPLPANRFEAYEHVTQHFIREHPLARRVAATLTTDQELLSTQDIRNALAYLAYYVQTNSPSGIISTDDIRQHLETFLQDETGLGLGLTRSDTREVLRTFTNIEEGSLGLIVSQGQSHVSFFHRSIQEFLASVHLSRMPLSDQQNALSSHIEDSRWREVILDTVFLCRRSEDADALVQALERVKLDPLAQLKRDDVLAEIAFKDTNVSLAYARTLTSQALQAIELSSIPSHRSRLVTHAMSGLRTRKNKTLVKDRMKRWSFSRGLWGPSRLTGLRTWPADEHTWDVLYRALNDEDASVMREAGDITAHLFGGRIQYGDAIANTAQRSDNSNQRAAAIECLSKGWPDHTDLQNLIDDGRNSISNEIRIAAVAASVRSGQRQANDLEALLALSWDRHSSATDYSWQSEVADALVAGFANDAQLKKHCMKSLGHHTRHPSLMDGSMALFVAIKAFPQDDDVATHIAEQLKRDYPFVSTDSIWKLLPTYFKDHPIVVPAIDAWISQRDNHDVIALHYGSLVGRTPVMKEKLFTALNQWVPFWAVGALLEGWGMDDLETAEKLLARAMQEDAAEIGQFIPEIYRDRDAAIERLTALLDSEKSQRIDTLFHGFSKLLPISNQAEIVTIALKWIKSQSSWRGEGILGDLILTFPGDERVKKLAHESLDDTYPPFPAVEEAYCNEEETRRQVAERISPLSAPLRYQIASDLSVFGDVQTAKEILRHWDSERNAEVKTQASIQYHSLVLPTDADRPEIEDSLAASLPCYGPDHEVRRQAIAAGLIVLRQLNRVLGRTETVGFNGQQVNLPVSDGSRQNRVFLNVLGKHWSYVKSALQDDLSILSSRIGSREIWDHVTGVAAAYPELAKDVNKEVETNASLRGSAGYLRFLSRTQPRSDNLAAACFDAIADQSQRHDWFDSVEAAATILGEQFSGDAKLEERLLTLVSPYHVPTDVLMALSLGWPGNEILRTLVFEDEIRSMDAGQMYPKYTTLAAARVPAVLETDILGAQENSFLANNIVRPLTSRIQRDADVADYLLQELTKSVNPSVKASFCKILALSRGISLDLDRWCREELLKQESRPIPEIGYDLLTKTTRSIRLCLLETLEGTSLSNSFAEGVPD